MTKKKIAFTIPVDIPVSIVKDITTMAQEYLFDEFGIKVKLKDNEDFLQLIQIGMKQDIENARLKLNCFVMSKRMEKYGQEITK